MKLTDLIPARFRAAPPRLSAANQQALTLALNTPQGRAFVGELARFSAGADFPVVTGPLGPYHAAADTRHRDYGASYFGFRPRPEEDMLRPFARAKIIARGRLLFRNNPYLSALLLAYVQELGTPTYKSAAQLQSREPGGKLVHDSVKSREYNLAREERLNDYFLDCESDHHLSLDEVVEIWGFEEAIAGELFVVKLYDGTIQLIPSELCGSLNYTLGSIPATGTYQDGTPLPAGATERDGLIRDAGQNLIAYRFAKRDPVTAALDFSPKATTVVPANYVWHLYDPDRVEMGRGVPMLAPILNTLLDVYETAEARTQQVKNQACLSMWITKNLDPYGYAEAMRGTMRTGLVDLSPELKQMATQRSNYQELYKGSVMYGAPGEDVKLIEPKPNAQDFHTHYIGLLQVCSACLQGMPVEVSIEGFRNSNYSSARATMNKWKRNVRRKRRRRETKLLNPLVTWQTNRAVLFGDLDKVQSNAKTENHWGWPAIPDIDESRTAVANAANLAMGATNLRAIYAERGLHHDVEMRQYVTEKGDFLEMFIAEGIARGLSNDQAQAWAITQIPSDAANSRALQALITATGAFTNDDGTAAPPGARVPGKKKPPAPAPDDPALEPVLAAEESGKAAA